MGKGTNLASLSFRIGANIKEFQTNMRKAANILKNTGAQMKSMGKSLSLNVTMPLAAAAGGAIKMASDLEESMNKVNTSFGSNAGKVDAWSKTTIEAFGIARGTALDMAATFGDMATSMGMNQGVAANMSTSLVGLAGDLASFKNIGLSQAMTALNGVFTGETESLKMLGVVMTEANLKAFALSTGIQKNYKDLTQAEKVQLRYAYVLAKTTNAQGDFARTGGSAANQTRTFQEQIKDLGAKFGENILPAFTQLVSRANDVISRLRELSPETQKTIISWLGFAAAIGPVMYGFGSIVKAGGGLVAFLPKLVKAFIAIKSVMNIAAITAGFKTGISVIVASFGVLKGALIALGGVIAANPIGALLTVLTAVAAALVIFRKRTNEAREAQWKLGQTVSDVNAEVGKQIFESLALGIEKGGDGVLRFTGSMDKLRDTMKDLSKNELESLKSYLENALANAMRTAQSSTSDLQAELAKQDVNTFRDALGFVNTELEMFTQGMDEIKPRVGIIGSLNDEIGKLRDAKEIATTEAEIASLNDQIKLLETRLSSLNGMSARNTAPLPTMKPKEAPGQIQSGIVLPTSDQMEPLREGIPIFQQLTLLGSELAGTFGSITNLLGNGMQTAFEAALISGENFWKAFGKMLTDMLKKLAATVASALVLASVFSLITGGAGGALKALGMNGAGFGDLFKGMFKNLGGIPGMASGGIVPAGFPNDTYPAFLSSGEMVVPQPKDLPSGKGEVLVGESRIKGSDLVIVFDRANQQRNRKRGF